MSAAHPNASARESEPEPPVTLSRRQRATVIAAAAALQRHARHDPDPLALLLAAAELRSIAAHPQPSGAAESADPRRLRAALIQIADAESGVWGMIARDALDGTTAPATTATRGASKRR